MTHWRAQSAHRSSVVDTLRLFIPPPLLITAHARALFIFDKYLISEPQNCCEYLKLMVMISFECTVGSEVFKMTLEGLSIHQCHEHFNMQLHLIQNAIYIHIIKRPHLNHVYSTRHNKSILFLLNFEIMRMPSSFDTFSNICSFL